MEVAKFKAAGIALLDSLGRRLSAETHDLAGGMLATGEWGLFVDELAAELFQDHTPISATERDLLREVLYTLEREPRDQEDYPMIWNRDEVMASLNVVDDAGAARRAG